jgi:hypothetical protein
MRLNHLLHFRDNPYLRLLVLSYDFPQALRIVLFSSIGQSKLELLLFLLKCACAHESLTTLFTPLLFNSHLRLFLRLLLLCGLHLPCFRYLLFGFKCFPDCVFGHEGCNFASKIGLSGIKGDVHNLDASLGKERSTM